MIDSGLQPGERVVLEGMRLQAGAKVTPKEVALDAAGAPLEPAPEPGASDAAEES